MGLLQYQQSVRRRRGKRRRRAELLLMLIVPVTQPFPPRASLSLSAAGCVDGAI